MLIKFAENIEIRYIMDASIIICSSTLIRNYVNDMKSDHIDLSIGNMTEEMFGNWLNYVKCYICGQKEQKTQEIYMANEYLCGFNFDKNIEENLVECADMNIIKELYNKLDKSKLFMEIIKKDWLECLLYMESRKYNVIGMSPRYGCFGTKCGEYMLQYCPPMEIKCETEFFEHLFSKNNNVYMLRYKN